MEVQGNWWRHSRLAQQVFGHGYTMLPTLLQDSQNCHGSQQMDLIQHIDSSRLENLIS